MADNPTLDQAMDAAVKEHVNATPEPKPTTETTTETKVEVPKPEKPPAVRFEGVSDMEIENSLKLARALNTPAQAADIIKVLANQVGLEVRVPETKKEAVAQAASLLDTLKMGVDPQFHYLVEALAPGLEKAIQLKAQELVTPIQVAERQRIEQEATREVDDAMAKFFKTHEDGKQTWEQMEKIAKRIAMAPGTDLADYLEDLYTIANRDRKSSSTVERTVRTMAKNAKDALPSAAEVDPSSVRAGSHLPSLDEAVKAAFRNQRLV